MEILRSYVDAREIGDTFEQISIDETFLEITEKTGVDEQGIFKDEIARKATATILEKSGFINDKV
jgi:hypothetical protein